MLKLDLMLVCIDCYKYASSIRAIYKCIEKIEFKEVLFLTDKNFLNLRFKTILIDKIISKEQYSEFIFKKLFQYINTEHFILMQYDGYIVNPNLWTDEFLEYDYIGAPWWYDEYNVGNGGFSLRSKRLLMELLGLNLSTYHPEDDIICRKLRPLLETKGIRFAPESLAEKFSIEPNGKHLEYKNNTFGFHGIGQFIL